MPIRLAALGLVLCVCARAQVVVNEAAIRAHLVNGKTVVTLALDNQRERPVPALIELEWLGLANQEDGLARTRTMVAPGNSPVEIPLPLSAKIADPLLERLRYRIDAGAANLTGFEPVRGIVNFANIADYAFSLRAIAPSVVLPGKEYELRVLTAHPVTGRPVPGVRITVGKSESISDKDGIAVLRVASGREEDSPNYMKARLGDLAREQEIPEIPAARRQVRIKCDKPIYQPGQTMHVRILVLGPNGNAEAGAEHSLKVFSENEDVEYAALLTTSRFGIAATDWEIPVNVKPGEYRIQIDGYADDEFPAQRTVSIRRYELPSFRVSVHLDRTYYLPHQTAAIAVRADYLFGKLVPTGKVRITEGDDGFPVSRGELNTTGQFQTTLTLDEPKFGEERFIDRHFTAFVTDPSTNRTEQRKFDVRVSRDSSHIYVAKEESTPNGQRLWITTYSPDGTPARSKVTVLANGRTLAAGRTNRFGLIRVDIPPSSAGLLIEASSDDGRRAEQAWTLQPVLSNNIWLETDRTLYRRGEAIRCRVSSAAKNATALLWAWNSRGQSLFSREIQLNNGNAVVDIPYDPKFGKELAIGVIAGALGPAASRMVVFPRAEELNVRVVPVKNEYRPGETARVELRASTRAAFGIAIVDQSVLERASTDAAFGPRCWFDFATDSQNSLGGITYSDLLNLDPSKIDAEVEQVAEVLVNDPFLPGFWDWTLERRQRAYIDAAQRELQPLKDALDGHYVRTLEYPRDERSYFEIAGGVPETRLDLWMSPYFPRFSIEGPDDVLRVCSAGPDKREGTDDDFCALEIRREWFARFESVMRDVLVRLADYPATTDEFIDLLDRAGLHFAGLKDPWGTALRCAIAYERDHRVIRINSAGPDRQWGTADDFSVVEFKGSYFSAMGARIEAALQAARQFPRTEADFHAALATTDLKFEELRDPWGRPYHVDFHSQESYYDRPQVYTYEEYRGLRESRKQLIPSKRSLRVADIKSIGPDGIPNTNDDFVLISFFRTIDTSSSNPEARTQPAASQLSPTGTGRIAGRLVDPSGATVANVLVTLNGTYSTRTNDAGEYVFNGLPGGYFRLTFDSHGFQTGVLDNVPVEPDHVTKADFVLQIGSVMQSVEVTAAQQTIATSNAKLATPHVRDYFPETLYWNPELITDAAGRATVQVKLADTITAWHMAIVASSEDGRITEASTDLRAFQPFQVDLDVPPVLTQGDRITLPVPVRNYLAHAQAVKVSAQPGNGLALEKPLEQPASIGASESADVLLPLLAASSADEARLRVTAIGRAASDAIEKPVQVHPDGEPVERSVTGVVGPGQVLQMNVPGGLIANSLQGQVKVYPTLIARLLETMQALLERPWGCGEQTISSTYPNLLFLKAIQQAGLEDPKLEARALRNLKSGYARLLGYQSDQGGFRYWASGEPDAALTAYALAFLTDAKEFIAVDADRVEAAQNWLKRQTPSGNSLRGFTLWALIGSGARDDAETIRKLGELARKAGEYDDPYSIAAFALAAMEAGRADLAEPAIRQLTALAKDEQGAAYWALRANTPFHGWGRAGQVETTALVLSAFAKWRKSGTGGMDLTPLIQRGALFLLKNTDPSGAWPSSQETVRALLALIQISGAEANKRPSEVEILVNGASAGRIAIGRGRQTVSGPAIVQVSRLLHPGANQLSFRSDGTEPVQLQLNASWYQPWTQPRTVNEFAMQTELSTTKAKVNEAVTCRVKITRSAFRGYGMMIAEIGLPPGVEVDRGTLASVTDDPKSGVDSFEVAPDHVTFYVWPQARDSSFQFVFRPRFAMTARMAPSALYDYYNPNERVSLVPETFSVN